MRFTGFFLSLFVAYSLAFQPLTLIADEGEDIADETQASPTPPRLFLTGFSLRGMQTNASGTESELSETERALNGSDLTHLPAQSSIPFYQFGRLPTISQHGFLDGQSLSVPESTSKTNASPFDGERTGLYESCAEVTASSLSDSEDLRRASGPGADFRP